MHDETNFDEMSNAVGMGLLASDIVLAIGKISRSVDLSDENRKALEKGRAVLDALGSTVAALPLQDGLSQLGSSSALDALQAVELKVTGETAQDLAGTLARELKVVLDGEPAKDHSEALAQISDLFAAIGNVEVMRVTNLSRPSQDVPPWLTKETSLT
jgi:hypothetical protein